MLHPQLARVAASLFKISPEDLSLKTGIGALELWDSLGQIHLILALERAFHVRFDSKQIPQLDSLEAIQRELHERGCLGAGQRGEVR